MDKNSENLIVDLFKDFIILLNMAKTDNPEENEKRILSVQKLFTKLSSKTDNPEKFIKEKLSKVNVK
jgi:hypothetical protein